MTIDLRARVTCNLGTLISASISDDFIQGNGLVKTSGSCVISGIVNPRQGDLVNFTYTKNGISRGVPRRLRVLSSFADPFRRITTVELGCKLTYMQDVTEPINWNAFNDPENSDLGEQDSRIIVFPIYASSIANYCLEQIGITASSMPLTNRFSIDQFSYESGYVNILGDLLVSESYFGYLDANEVLQVLPLDQTSASGPLIAESKVIDISPINVGGIPGDSVFVSYNSLKLKAPDDTEIACRNASEDVEPPERRWGDDVTTSIKVSAIKIAYDDERDTTGSPLRFRDYTSREVSTEVTEYDLYDVMESGRHRRRLTDGGPLSSGGNNPDFNVVERVNLVKKRTVTQITGSSSLGGTIIPQFLGAGLGFNNFDVETITTETFQYDDYGNEVSRILETRTSLFVLLGGMNIPVVFDTPDGGRDGITLPLGPVLRERIITETVVGDGVTKIITQRFGPWSESIRGQQSIANANSAWGNTNEIISYLNDITGAVFLIDTTIETSREGARGPIGPVREDIIKEELAEESADPDNGYSTSSESQIEFITGSQASTRRIEFSMPYAPDDSFDRRVVSTDPLRYCYYSRSSDAAEKANLYGRIQNRMLMGNRNGMNIQLEPELLPSAPFSSIFIQAAGTIALYKTNAMSWTIDQSGIVASVEAMFWGTAGRTA
jgi:hypothetical protein